MKLTIDLTTFYSMGDERRFFQGLSGNPAISRVRGVGRQLEITIVQSRLNRDAIRELIALFWRYQIPLSPLLPISKKQRFEWLNDEKWYWYKEMFLTDALVKPGKRINADA